MKPNLVAFGVDEVREEAKAVADVSLGYGKLERDATVALWSASCQFFQGQLTVIFDLSSFETLWAAKR